MKKYFFSNGKDKFGPFTLEELKIESVDHDTLIWREGLDDWTPAKNLDEMKPVLELIPPQIVETLTQELDTENEPTALTDNDSLGDSENIPLSEAKQEMFHKPFSFSGRIRRTEYGYSLIIYVILNRIVIMILDADSVPYIGLAYIPMVWFLLAQGTKRCHDLGQSGWLQIIPFYALWLIFAKGESGENQYGANPKQ